MGSYPPLGVGRWGGGAEEHDNMGTLFLGIYPLDRFMMDIEREHVSISFFLYKNYFVL